MYFIPREDKLPQKNNNKSVCPSSSVAILLESGKPEHKETSFSRLNLKIKKKIKMSVFRKMGLSE